MNESNNYSENIAIKITFVALRSDISSLSLTIGEQIALINKLNFINILSLFDSQNGASLKTFKTLRMIRNLVVNISKNPEFLRFRRYVVASATFKVDSAVGPFKIDAKVLDKSVNCLMFRRAALTGLQLPELDLAYDYEFRKNASNYSIIITKSIFEGIDVTKHFDLGFFPELCPSSQNKTSNYSLCLTKADNAHWQKIEPYSCWSSIRLINATILHGQLISSNEQLYFTDSSREPVLNEGQLWPSTLLVSDANRIFTPAPVSELDSLSEGIFIGGTNNWMHFVLEDLPRIILTDLVGVPKSTPLIFRSKLSKQIKETIQVISNRKIVFVDTHESLKCNNLIAFRFENPLTSVMSGNQKNANKLVNLEILDLARERIFSHFPHISGDSKRIIISRKVNLFRPLTNARKLQSRLGLKYGFEVVDLSDKTLEQVLRIFKNAEIIVGEYGAGLANVIFCERRPLVIEIRGSLEKRALEYETLVKKLNMRHVCVPGKLMFVSKFGISKGPFRVSVRKVFQSFSAMYSR